MTVTIPGFATLRLEHLVLDYNGTLAKEGRLQEGVSTRLNALAADLKLHVVTADTFGSVAQALASFDLDVTLLHSADHTAEKADLIRRLGADRVVAVGNGNNDRAMLECAALGIAVAGAEGCATPTLLAADLFTPSITEALDLLLDPRRLVATLRR